MNVKRKIAEEIRSFLRFLLPAISAADDPFAVFDAMLRVIF